MEKILVLVGGRMTLLNTKDEMCCRFAAERSTKGSAQLSSGLQFVAKVRTGVLSMALAA